MDNFTTEILRILARNLETASYYVSKGMTDKAGYHISEERASYLIARSLERKSTIDFLIDMCLHIEDQDNSDYADRIHSLLNDRGGVNYDS